MLNVTPGKVVPMLNPDSPLPLYQQLVEVLRDKIRSGEYPPESRLPSEYKLAETHGIGRPTVRQALDVLERKGMVARRRGAGTFVLAQDREVDLFSLAGTTAAFMGKGVRATRRMLSKTRLISVGQRADNPFKGEQAYFFSRLSRVKEAPVLIEDIYLHGELFPGIDELDLAGQSLSRVVDERYYMRPKGGRQTFSITYLSGPRAAALDVAVRTPILLVKRFLHFSQAQNAIYAELYCRTDRFVFAQEIGGMTHV